MANINELFEKYFKAETSIAEENEIKQYFKSENVDPIYEKYRALFLCFETELNLKMPVENMNIKFSAQNNHKKFWLRGMSLSGIAASLILGFWFFSVDSNSDYAVINGSVVEDEYLVQQIAFVKENLKSISAISKTRNKITDIKNTINFKK